jgi:hypothetical protein
MATLIVRNQNILELFHNTHKCTTMQLNMDGYYGNRFKTLTSTKGVFHRYFINHVSYPLENICQNEF